MTAFTLTIGFTANDLRAIHAAGESVVILRQPAPGIEVVWAAFAPFELNTVQWTDSFSLYATQTPREPGEIVLPVAQVPTVTPQYLYPFSAQQFGAGTLNPQLPPDQCETTNNPNNGGALGFGLAQTPRINSVPLAFCPVSADEVLAGQAGFFELANELTVMLRSQTQTAMVIDYVPVGAMAATVAQSAAITLSFTAASAAQAIQYDGATGTFLREPARARRARRG
ncbi:hypothetical protein LVJ94_26630 [Pendulispora rubella]|uniref:Uncharacterized protein n=1 Tax=Pendulispora rubella TaxID=2741070 RepID=A0ABZ2KP91_9BACT